MGRGSIHVKVAKKANVHKPFWDRIKDCDRIDQVLEVASGLRTAEAIRLVGFLRDGSVPVDTPRAELERWRALVDDFAPALTRDKRGLLRAMLAARFASL